MITLHQVTKRFGEQIVLDSVSLQINAGERIGVVGPNGAGKSTLFGLITGGAETDQGEVRCPGGLRLGLLRQLIEAEGSDSLLGFTLRAVPALEALHAEIVRLEARLAAGAGDESPRLLRRLGECQTRYEHDGGYQLQARAQQALGGLGFSTDDFDRPFAEFSGGWRMRAELARVLIADPDVLLLDEPSNYLDLPAVEWLQRHLRAYAGTLLLISHDRSLLRALAGVILEVQGGRITRFACGYDGYVEQRVARREQQLAAWRNQEKRRAQLERFIERFRAKNTKATQAQSRMKMLEKMEEVDIPDLPPESVLLHLPEPPHSGRETVRLENVGLTYDGERWVLRGVNLTLERGDKVALVGYNGMGKTSLLRLLAGRREPSEGRRVWGHQVVVGYQAQELTEVLPPEEGAYRVVRDAADHETHDQEVRSILGLFGFSGPRAEKPVKVLSGGERIRLAFARLFIAPPNFVVLDEPTTHLDIQGREALEQALAEYPGTVALVSHDVSFVRKVATQILALGGGRVERYHGDYDYYLSKAAERGVGAYSVEGALAAGDPAKQRRIDVARRRQELRAELRRVDRRIEQAEAEIIALEARRDELASAMSDPGGKGGNFAGLGAELSGVQRRLDEITALWESLGAQRETWSGELSALE
jgi:ATP-binding cassette subfamily F protein 3